MRKWLFKTPSKKVVVFPRREVGIQNHLSWWHGFRPTCPGNRMTFQSFVLKPELPVVKTSHSSTLPQLCLNYNNTWITWKKNVFHSDIHSLDWWHWHMLKCIICRLSDTAQQYVITLSTHLWKQYFSTNDIISELWQPWLVIKQCHPVVSAEQ